MIETLQSAIFYDEPKVLISDWNDKYARLIINPVQETRTELRNKPGSNDEFEEVQVSVWKAKTLLVEKPYTRETIIEALIRTKYTVSDELGLLRQRDTKPEEFEEYNVFVEDCKSIANSLILIHE
jgi:hypothetical protein